MKKQFRGRAELAAVVDLATECSPALKHLLDKDDGRLFQTAGWLDARGEWHAVEDLDAAYTENILAYLEERYVEAGRGMRYALRHRLRMTPLHRALTARLAEAKREEAARAKRERSQPYGTLPSGSVAAESIVVNGVTYKAQVVHLKIASSWEQSSSAPLGPMPFALGPVRRALAGEWVQNQIDPGLAGLRPSGTKSACQILVPLFDHPAWEAYRAAVADADEDRRTGGTGVFHDARAQGIAEALVALDARAAAANDLSEILG